MKNFSQTVAAFASAILFSLSAQGTEIVVDLFDTDQTQVTDNTESGGGFWSTQIFNASEILGGYRDIYVEKITDLAPINNPNRSASIDVSSGYLNFSSSTSTRGLGIVRWDGNTTGVDGSRGGLNKDGLGGIFLGNPVTDAFALRTIFSDLDFRFTVEAYTFGDPDSWSIIELSSSANDAPDPGTLSLIPLLAFSDCGFNAGGVIVTCGINGPVDFTHLGALQSIINVDGGVTSVDLSLNQIKSVSVTEPTTLSLLGFGLLGLGVLRRRTLSAPSSCPM